MGLFKKPKLPEETTAGRRRPVFSDPAKPRSNNQIFSYHSRRSSEPGNTGRREPVETLEDRPVHAASGHRYIVIASALALFILVGLLSYLMPQPKIILLQDDTTAYFLQDSSVYQTAARKQLSESLLSRNKFTINTQSLRVSLLKTYPEIKSATVTLPIFGRQPTIYIEPYKPAFIVTNTTSQAFLLDETGRALASTSQITDIDSLELTTVTDTSAAQVSIGKRALPSTTVAFVRNILAALKAKSVTPSSLTLLTNSSELDVAIEDRPYFVKFNLQNDALQQAGTYLAVRNRLESQKTMPSQYIDVRVPERAYYK